jgi:hypothetical protein
MQLLRAVALEELLNKLGRLLVEVALAVFFRGQYSYHQLKQLLLVLVELRKPSKAMVAMAVILL